MKEDSTSISAIMTVFNDRKKVERFLQSFVKQTFDAENIEFIVVDAGSDDGTVDVIESYQDKLPNLNLILEEGCNRSEGRNIAIKKTSGDFIFTFDADISMDEDCVENLIRSLEEHPEAGAIAAMQKYPESQNFFAKCVYHIPGMSHFSPITAPEIDDIDMTEIHTVTCACGIWRREALPEDLFDERFNWGEDLEFHQRMKKEGWKIYGTRNAQFEHFYKDSLKGFWGQQIGYGKGASILWKTVGRMRSWGLGWKSLIPILLPIGVIIWIYISLMQPWMGMILFFLGMVPPLPASITALKRQRNLKLFFGVFFVQILKYIANFFGFWKGVFEGTEGSL